MVLAATDFAACAFKDNRLSERFRLILTDLDAQPACPLPLACRDTAALKAAYRFFDHPDTPVERLLPAFVVPSARRACRRRRVLAVHDSTSFNFSSLAKADGLGFINDSACAKGIHLHSSLLLDPDGYLLGLAHLHFWVRTDFRAESAETIRHLPIEDKESFKWLLGVRATTDALRSACTPRAGPPRVIHVMDREGDVHEVFAFVRRLRQDAVIRCAQDRRVEGDEPEAITYSKAKVAASKCLGTMPLRVPLKDGGYRTATVEVRSVPVRLRPSEKRRKGRAPLTMWLIQTREVSQPPAGEKAAGWWIWTSLKAQTLSQVQRVLKIYQARWRVEEYHRMLKTGCQVERLRLCSAAKLQKVIAMKAWVAVRVVRIRDEVKRDAEQDAENCFSAAEWKLLFARQHGRSWRESDGRPTLGQVVKWLGRLGGHLGRKGDGMPGAEVLSRALYALDLLLEGQHLARLDQTDAETQPPQPPTSHQLPRG